MIVLSFNAKSSVEPTTEDPYVLGLWVKKEGLQVEPIYLTEAQRDALDKTGAP